MHTVVRSGRGYSMRWRRLAVLLCCLTGAACPALAQTQDSVTARLDKLERTLGNQGLLDLARQVDQLQMELRQMRGEIENQRHLLEQVRDGQRQQYIDLDNRLSGLEPGRSTTLSTAGYVPGPRGALPDEPPLATTSATSSDTVAGDPAEGLIARDAGGSVSFTEGRGKAPSPVTGNAGSLPERLPNDAQTATPPLPQSASANIIAAAPSSDSAASEAAYKEAFALLKEGRYDESITGFSAFLQQFPNSQYADNAQYWLGEAYYVMRQFEPAIAQYQTLIADYPNSQKQSHAMLKIAYSYAELGLQEQALAVLSDLKTRFPGSAAARLADERIQRLRSDMPSRQ